MKRLLVPLLLAVCALQAHARELIACGHPAYPPVSWVAGGELRGLAPTLAIREDASEQPRDLARLGNGTGGELQTVVGSDGLDQLFAELGLTVRLEAFGNWKRCLQEVREGRADIVVAAYRNRERERHFAFSAHHLVVDPIVLFVRRDRRFVFDDWEDLRGRSVGLLLGDSFGERFDRFAETALRVERVSTGRQNMRKLVLGRIDFMPIGRESGRLQRRQLGYEDVVEALPQPLVTEYYHVAVRKGSELEALLPEIDLRLTALHADGGIARALQAHAERYLAEPPEADAGDEKLD